MTDRDGLGARVGFLRVAAAADDPWVTEGKVEGANNEIFYTIGGCIIEGKGGRRVREKGERKREHER